VPGPAAPDPPRGGPGRGALLGGTLALFLVWSNTFLVFEVLLAPRTGPAPLGAVDLLLVRFLPTAALCAAWLAAARRAQVAALLRAHPLRLAVAAVLCVPGYNSLLYLGMERRVEGPVASVLTSLAPLYLVVIGALFLGESVTRRKVLGLALGLGGVALLATARRGAGAPASFAVLQTALAPLAWAGYTALTKPVTREHSPLDWTFLVLAAGGVAALPLLPFARPERVAALGAAEWGMVAYLVFAATLAGFAAWSWLLRHLPAGTVGLTIFLNPPLTLATKALLATLLPATFPLTVLPLEAAGGLLALAGVALAVARPRGSSS
jgi:O-acetylserine/cysteine efflux transporter